MALRPTTGSLFQKRLNSDQRQQGTTYGESWELRDNSGCLFFDRLLGMGPARKQGGRHGGRNSVELHGAGARSLSSGKVSEGTERLAQIDPEGSNSVEKRKDTVPMEKTSTKS